MRSYSSRGSRPRSSSKNHNPRTCRFCHPRQDARGTAQTAATFSAMMVIGLHSPALADHTYIPYCAASHHITSPRRHRIAHRSRGRILPGSDISERSQGCPVHSYSDPRPMIAEADLRFSAQHSQADGHNGYTESTNPNGSEAGMRRAALRGCALMSLFLVSYCTRKRGTSCRKYTCQRSCSFLTISTLLST
jgi:hypothetical protein